LRSKAEILTCSYYDSVPHLARTGICNCITITVFLHSRLAPMERSLRPLMKPLPIEPGEAERPSSEIFARMLSHRAQQARDDAAHRLCLVAPCVPHSSDDSPALHCHCACCKEVQVDGSSVGSDSMSRPISPACPLDSLPTLSSSSLRRISGHSDTTWDERYPNQTVSTRGMKRPSPLSHPDSSWGVDSERSCWRSQWSNQLGFCGVGSFALHSVP
jgi:hypothetical protein